MQIAQEGKSKQMIPLLKLNLNLILVGDRDPQKILKQRNYLIRMCVGC